jgi:hypothetical protein
MSNYTKLTDFASKDSLPSGNAGKIVKGTEIDDEFAAIETAVASKLDSQIGAWTIEQSGSNLVFKYNGGVVLTLGSTGEITVS